MDEVFPNPAQPRQVFEEGALRELAESISRYGILQPVTVRRTADKYVLVTGERRLRAAKMAGLRHIPCILTELDDAQSAAIALVENLHRRDLNYIEEAEGLRALIKDCGISREEAARRIGKSLPAVSNKLRLLQLSPALRARLLSSGCTERHARALLRLPDDVSRSTVLETILREDLTVAKTEALIDRLFAGESMPAPVPHTGKATYVVKDVRLFLNTVNRSVDLMRRSGIEAKCGRDETEDAIILTIRIPKTPRRRAP